MGKGALSISVSRNFLALHVRGAPIRPHYTPARVHIPSCELLEDNPVKRPHIQRIHLYQIPRFLRPVLLWFACGVGAFQAALPFRDPIPGWFSKHPTGFQSLQDPPHSRDRCVHPCSSENLPNLLFPHPGMRFPQLQHGFRQLRGPLGSADPFRASISIFKTDQALLLHPLLPAIQRRSWNS